MPRKPDPTLRPAIVAKVADHLGDTKLEDVSVRSLGRVLGTSAYPIVYHFGTRESLIDAVVDHLAAPVRDVALDPASDAAALRSWILTVYGGLESDDRALAARLTFELGSVEVLDGRDRQRRLHREHVETLAAWCRAHGASDADAEHDATATVLAARGVQWGAVIDPCRAITADTALGAIAGALAARTCPTLAG